MTPVLFAPVSPCAPAITPNYTALLCDPEFKNVIKSLVITLANEDIDFRESLKDVFDYHMATSELRVLKRLSVVETDLGHNDLAYFEEEHVPTIPEQIKTLSDRLEQPLNKTTEEEMTEFYIPHTTLDLKACELVRHLKEDVKPRNNEVFLNSREIIHYMKTAIPEELRLKDIRNPRQAKKDILERAVKMFSNIVCVVKNKSGNKVTGIALKPSVNRRYTDTC
jgi:hypothetical protein